MSNTNTALIPGSLSAVTKRSGLSLAESFLSVDVLLIVDTSGSMQADDAPGGRQRIDVAEEELRRLQADLPGKVGIVAFSDSAVFCPSGIPARLFGGTNMAKALRFVKPADGLGIRLILISDGLPDSTDAALKEARTFKTHVDVVYIGPEHDPMGGREFLRKLAAATGGSFVQAKEIAKLAEPIRLLLGAVDCPRTPGNHTNASN